ncbi:thermonuclease family protein [Sphingopyxis fribergensis]
MILALYLVAAVVPTGQAFTCTPESVWDGDGPIWCKEGPRIRLAGIAAREIDGSCKAGHPCPAADPIASRDHLVRLVGESTGMARTGHVVVRGPAMRCVSRGSAGGNRTAAFCVSPRSGDLSCAMVRDGYAQKWEKYWRGHRCDRSTQ